VEPAFAGALGKRPSFLVRSRYLDLQLEVARQRIEQRVQRRVAPSPGYRRWARASALSSSSLWSLAACIGIAELSEENPCRVEARNVLRRSTRPHQVERVDDVPALVAPIARRHAGLPAACADR
jgi:hypothetical protein